MVLFCEIFSLILSTEQGDFQKNVSRKNFAVFCIRKIGQKMGKKWGAFEMLN